MSREPHTTHINLSERNAKKRMKGKMKATFKSEMQIPLGFTKIILKWGKFK